MGIIGRIISLGLTFFIACASFHQADSTVSGDELHIGIDMENYSPGENLYLEGSNRVGLIDVIIYSTLFKYAGEGSLKPNLVKKFETNGDQTQWTVELRSPVYFHDGSRLTAQDVKATFDYVRNNKESTNYELLTSLQEIKVLAENRIQFILKNYDSFFPYALQLIFISKAEEIENTSLNKNNGSGFYKIEMYDEKKRVLTLIRANQDRKDRAYLDKIVIHFFANYLDGLVMLNKQEIDLLYLSDPTYERLLENDRNYRVIYQKKPVYYVLDFNSDDGREFHSQKKRQWIARVVPSRKIVDKMKEYSDSVSKADSFFQNQPFNFENVLENGTTEINIISYEEHEFSAFIMYQLLQDFYSYGTHLQVKLFPFSKFVEMVGKHEFDMALYPADFLFDDYYVHQYFKSKEAYQLLNEDEKEYLEEMRKQPDSVKRQEAYAHVQKLFSEKVPFYVLLQRNIPMAIHNRFRGYNQNPDEIMDEVEKMWVPKKEQKYK